MSLGETIYRLRSERGMSQGDLADLLDVSRQSVSRWETDGATPELDKLVKLGGVFGVTLDELVTGAKAELVPEPEPPVMPQAAAAPPPQQGNRLRPHRTAGIVLLCMGFLVVVLITLLGDLLFGLLFASPFLACGTICLTARRHVGLWCAWAVYLSVDFYLRFAAGSSWGAIWLTPIWTYEWNYARLAVAWVQFLVMLLLMVLTLVAFRKLRLRLEGRGKLLFILGWVLYAATYIPLPIPISFYNEYRFLAALAVAALDWTRTGLLTALLAISLGLLRNRRRA